MCELFPEQLDGVDLEHFYRGINKVEPSFIRVEADEVTYNLHIMLRFNIELALLEGDLTVGGLPVAWNDEFRRLFGISPDSNRNGVLQDIHWSMGGFGYFPTYALGNLYGAQFVNTLRSTFDDLDSRIESGDFASILGWQRKHIHNAGRMYPATELCKRVTGSDLDPTYLMKYVREKYSGIYGV